MPRRVLVTGATGFLGRHVCEAFLSRGIPVRALVRQPGSPAPAGAEQCRISGLDDLTALRSALTGVEAVVHLAAHVHQRSIPADDSAEAAMFRTVNVEGTRNLLDAAVAVGVRDFLTVSSVKAVGEGSAERLTETTPPAPADAYGATKLEAERLARDAAVRHHLHAPILRLPLVYGPGMKGNALQLFDAVARGTPLPFGAIRNCRSLLYVGNLIAAIFATLEREAGNDTFFVSDLEDLSTPELIRAVAGALGRPVRLVPVPIGLLRLAARTGDLLSRVIPFPLTSASLDRLAGSLTVDCSRLMSQTGYRPAYSVADGLRLTAEWHRTRGGAI